MSTNTANTSLWTETAPVTDPPALDHNKTCDVCVVGAGIAGLSVAYLLAKAGKKVVVLDDGPVASGQTHLTTAHLANEIDDRYTEIKRIHGADGARLAAESHSSAIDLIEAICRDEKIKCDFQRVDGYLFRAPEHSQQVLEDEYQAALETGIVQVSWADGLPISGFLSDRCLRFAQQGQFHPLKYLAGLCEAIKRFGGELHCHTHVKSIKGGSDAHVETEAGLKVNAKAVVVATNTPVNDMFAIHTKQAPYRSYVVALRVPKGTVPPALYWDTLDPYHYVRVQRNDDDNTSDVLIVGGEDHKSGQADDESQRYDHLEAWTRERFSQAGEVLFRWSGQVMETMDGLAFIGRNPGDKENVYIATGDSGMGMTHGVIAGMLISDLILGKENPWAKLYDPSRTPVGAVGDFAKENLNVAAQYAAWVTPGEVKDEKEIANGCGAVMWNGMHKVACYRDDKGNLTKMTAVCPHLQCIVDWNDASKTWDCPCHGSIFAPDGKVLNGPANVDLKKVE
jgi:glycine/D-amino acid oxidase-like deaminating enzyme/nitrite reductase/ring-hydroxylating ferredoxin subunit